MIRSGLFSANLVMEEYNARIINQNKSPGRKILGEINHSGRCVEGANPLSPTANLKLLTKVASNLESKATTDVDFNREGDPKLKKHLPLQSVKQQPDENLKSRKDKSLGSLCNR